jgi:RNA polymerase primary sigma factor
MRPLNLKNSRQITTRNSESIGKYLNEISKFRSLTPDEEVRLALRAKKGDAAAADALINANLRFVVSVAKQYQNQGLSLEDLIAEGNLGLMKALEKFNPCYGFKFISYAVWWVRQSILSALAQHARLVRLPFNQIGALNKIQKAWAKLEQEFERAPAPHEIAQLIEGMSASEVSDTLKIARKSISLDSPLPGEETDSLHEKLPAPNAPSPDQRLIDESLTLELERALQTLTPREAEVIRLYFGIGVENSFTLEEIGERFDLTRERVRQIKEKAIRRLRHTSRSKMLKAYLG